jgi:hypothetical protein
MMERKKEAGNSFSENGNGEFWLTDHKWVILCDFTQREMMMGC